MQHKNMIEVMARAICWAQNYSLPEEEKEQEFSKCKPYYLDSAKAALEAVFNHISHEGKKAYPSYTTTGGYLKYYSDIKHAYIESWEKASKEDREKTYKLPNFDPVVFKEIFGFNPSECVEEKREYTAIDFDVIEINGVKYKKI